MLACGRPFEFRLALVDLLRLREELAVRDPREKILTLLSPVEKKTFSSFSYTGRKVEWLGGRIACKAAVLHLEDRETTAAAMAEAVIGTRENGAPQLRKAGPAERQNPALSISHSRKYAAAMVAHALSCGVDIQEVSGKARKVAPRFADPAEIALLEEKVPGLDETQHLTLLWSAKEALKKSLLADQPVIFQGILLSGAGTDDRITLRLRSPGKKDPARVTAALLDNYILAYTGETRRHARTA